MITTFSIRVYNSDRTASAVLSYDEVTQGVNIPDAALSGLIDAQPLLANWNNRVSADATWWEECEIPEQAHCGEKTALPCRVWNTPGGLAFEVQQ